MPGERSWRDVVSADGPFAELSCPQHPSILEHNPATVAWRGVLLDPDLAGLAPARPLVERIVIADRGRRWPLPLSGVLATRLAWHPELPLTAGLAVRDRRAYPWVADYRAREVTVYDHIQVALSVRAPDRVPLLWCGGTRLLLTVPAAPRPAPVEDRVPRQVVLQAVGPGRVDLLPGTDVLEGVAAARIAVLDLKENRVRGVSEAMLVSDVRGAGDKVRVDHLSGDTDDGRGDPPDFGLSREVAYVGIGDAVAPPSGGVVETGTPTPPPVPPSTPVHGEARLTFHAEPGRTGPVVLWIHAAEPGGTPLGHPPPTLIDCGYPVAVLDLPIDWPADATADLVSGQVTTAVRTATGVLAERHPGPVVVGGHSFGAALALHALTRLTGLSAAIVHSGCYNRTLTPYGFHREQRSYWEAPDVYRAFSAVHDADRLAGPVLIVHGADDLNPATPASQAVQFYQAVVAAGGRTRLVLLPYEGHNFWYRENLCFLTDEHAAWLAQWTDRKAAER